MLAPIVPPLGLSLSPHYRTHGVPREPKLPRSPCLARNAPAAPSQLYPLRSSPAPVPTHAQQALFTATRVGSKLRARLQTVQHEPSAVRKTEGSPRGMEMATHWASFRQRGTCARRQAHQVNGVDCALPAHTVALLRPSSSLDLAPSADAQHERLVGAGSCKAGTRR